MKWLKFYFNLSIGNDSSKRKSKEAGIFSITGRRRFVDVKHAIGFKCRQRTVDKFSQFDISQKEAQVEFLFLVVFVLGVEQKQRPVEQESQHRVLLGH